MKAQPEAKKEEVVKKQTSEKVDEKIDTAKAAEATQEAEQAEE